MGSRLAVVRRLQLVALAALVATVGCAPMRRVVRFKDPLNFQEHLQLGLMYEQKGQYGPAEREYKAAVKREPENVPAILALGNAQFAQDKLKEAEKSFARALKLVPGHPGASNNLAMTYVKRGRKLKDAEALALQARNDAAMRPYALDTLAAVYLKSGKLELAREALTEARAAAPAGDEAFLRHLEESEKRLEESGAASAPANAQPPENL